MKTDRQKGGCEWGPRDLFLACRGWNTNWTLPPLINDGCWTGLGDRIPKRRQPDPAIGIICLIIRHHL